VRIFVAAATLACGPALAAEPPPSFSNLDGGPTNLRDLEGRVVVLNFWATWCVPCLEEMPLLDRLHREYSAKGVTFVGASADDESTRRHIPAVIEETGVSFPIW